VAKFKMINVTMGNAGDIAGLHGPGGSVVQALLIKEQPNLVGLKMVVIATQHGLGLAHNSRRTGYTSTSFLPCPRFANVAEDEYGVRWDEIKYLFE